MFVYNAMLILWQLKILSFRRVFSHFLLRKVYKIVSKQRYAT